MPAAASAAGADGCAAVLSCLSAPDRASPVPVAAARAAVDAGDYTAAILIPADFSALLNALDRSPQRILSFRNLNQVFRQAGGGNTNLSVHCCLRHLLSSGHRLPSNCIDLFTIKCEFNIKLRHLMLP